jgi:hypothetical protein
LFNTSNSSFGLFGNDDDLKWSFKWNSCCFVSLNSPPQNTLVHEIFPNHLNQQAVYGVLPS